MTLRADQHSFAGSRYGICLEVERSRKSPSLANGEALKVANRDSGSQLWRGRITLVGADRRWQAFSDAARLQQTKLSIRKTIRWICAPCIGS